MEADAVGRRSTRVTEILIDNDDALGRLPRPLREQFVHARHQRFRLRLTAVPADQDLLALSPSEERKTGEAAIGIGRGAF